MKRIVPIICLIILLCGCNGPYNANGYNVDGYDWLGFDEGGFGKDGYNLWGYNSSGYNKQGYNSSGYNMYGVNKNGLTPAQQAEANRYFWANYAAGMQESQRINDQQRDRALREAQIDYYNRPYEAGGVLYIPPQR